MTRRARVLLGLSAGVVLALTAMTAVVAFERLSRAEKVEQTALIVREVATELDSYARDGRAFHRAHPTAIVHWYLPRYVVKDAHVVDVFSKKGAPFSIRKADAFGCPLRGDGRRVWSVGANGVDEDGDGDDITVPFSAPLWDEPAASTPSTR